MEKLGDKSMNIVAENIIKMKGLFPEVFCEDKIDFEKLKEVLGEYTENKEERYSFNWKGKSKSIRLAQTASTGTLRPCKEESKNWDATENLYIEGDNLEVLKLLQKSYNSKVKMIYIDPPYNTGKDFVYPDDFRDNIKNYLEITGQVDAEGRKLGTNSEASGRYHTDWLNMMYPRLRLARNLISDDGVIFISINDNEVNNLRKVCDEIFCEDNFVAQMNIITGANQSGEGVKIQKNIEYCLVYAKNEGNLTINKVDATSEIFRNLNDAPTSLETRPELGYSIYYNKETGDLLPVKDYLKEKIYLNEVSKVYSDDKQLLLKGYIPIRPGMRNKKLHRWRWGIETFIERKNEVIIQEKSGKYSAFFKQDGFNAPKNYNNFSGGANELKALFDGIRLFDYPKSTDLIKYLVNIGLNMDGYILDFFSGSSTTAHSVMQLNTEDGGSRKFIMVQLPEACDKQSEAIKCGYKNICEIGKERIRRAGEKIIKENKAKEGIENLDIGFKVFKLDSSNIKKWNVNGENLEISIDNMIDNFVPNRTEEDIVYEIMLKYGIDLTYPVEMRNIADKKVFSIGFGALIICIDDEITLEVVEGIVKFKEELNPEITRVVFKDNGFENDSVKTNAIHILRRNNIQEIISI